MQEAGGTWWDQAASMRGDGALIYVAHQVIVLTERGVYEDLKARNVNIPRSADGAGAADVFFVEGGIQVLLPFRGSRFGVLSSCNCVLQSMCPCLW